MDTHLPHSLLLVFATNLFCITNDVYYYETIMIMDFGAVHTFHHAIAVATFVLDHVL